MKAEKNCWTCKGSFSATTLAYALLILPERKIGCDRALPTCQNCHRSHRTCKGYALKLAWPDKFDGRRKQLSFSDVPFEENRLTNYHNARMEDGLPFLNTTFADLRMEKLRFQDLVPNFESDVASMSIPRSPAYGQCSSNNDASLLSYCKSSSISAY